MYNKVDGIKRLNVELPIELVNGLKAIADRKHTTTVDVLRRFVRLGLLAAEIEERPGADLVIKEGEKETRLLLI